LFSGGHLSTIYPKSFRPKSSFLASIPGAQLRAEARVGDRGALVVVLHRQPHLPKRSTVIYFNETILLGFYKTFPTPNRL
jgi:hypothetical protein